MNCNLRSDICNLKTARATILVITLWIITLISAIALSLTYRMRLEIQMTSNELSIDKAYYLANAGIIQAVSVLSQDAGNYDALSEPWSNHIEGIYGFNPFKDVSVGDGKFNVSYIYESDISIGLQEVFYGMEDEERKININKAGQDVLESLPGITPEIALSIRAWRGDTGIGQDILIQEDTYYQSLQKPYKRKGKPIEYIQELILVRGITPELLYGKDIDGNGEIDVSERTLVKYITVYGDGLININTASATVLRAIGFTEDLAYRFMGYRFGVDYMLGTGDDGIFTDVGKIAETLNYFTPLSVAEQELIIQKQSLLKVSSRYYTAKSEGSIPGKAKCTLTAVMDKESAEGDQIVGWSE